MNKNQSTQQSGYILILGIVVMAILITMSGALWGYTALQIKGSSQAISKTQAWHIAEAGIDKALSELNTGSSFSGESDVALNEGTYTTTITSIDSNNKQIISTGYIPNSTNPIAEVTVKVNVSIDLSAVAFNFGVQIGEGGLTMANNSTITGNLYSNGNVSGTGTITGDATVAGGGSPTLDQQCTTNSGAFAFNPSGRNDAGQKFTPAISGSLTKISLYIKKNGSPSNATVRILTDNSGTPSRTQVGGSGTITSSTVSGSYSWLDVTFATNPSLTSGTAYWLLVDSAGSTTNYYSIGVDADDSCSNGTSKYSTNWNASPPVYTAFNKDFNFKTYMGGATTSLSGLTINGNARANSLLTCSIGGDAYYASTNTCSVGGTSNSGVADSPQQAMPISQAQIDDWETTAESGGTIAGYTMTGTTTLGPKKITGNLTISGTLYLTGPIWVTGNITMTNNAVVYVHSSLGNTGTVLIADDPSDPAGGKVSMSNNVIIAGNGNPDSFPLVLANSNANDAMTISNNVAGAIFYVPNGRADVSNNGGGNQITAYALHLNNNASVNYVTGLADTTFSNGPGGAWAIVAGTYMILD